MSVQVICRQTILCRKRDDARGLKMVEGIAEIDDRIDALGGGRCKGSVEFLGLGRLNYRRSHAKVRAVRGNSSANYRLCNGFSGLTRIAIFVALGTSSRRISIRFAVKSPGTSVARPVMLPPGRDRLCTRPSPTGSATATNTIGMVAVADFRATAGCGPEASNNSGVRATRSAAKLAGDPGQSDIRQSGFCPQSSPFRASR